MTKYIVKKEFVDEEGVYINSIGAEIKLPDLPRNMIGGLKGGGFIEEVKEYTRWFPKTNHYYYVVIESDVRLPLTVEEGSFLNRPERDDYNIFHSRETAEKVAEALKLVFTHVHTPASDVLAKKELYDDLFDAMENARKAVIKDDGATE